MKHEELIGNLKRLHLTTIAKDYVEIARLCEKKKSTLEQYLAAVVGAEISARNQQKIIRLIKEAKLSRDKHLETYDFKARIGINAQQVRRLSEGEFIKEHANVVFYGHIGVGKSHLAEGLTRALCALGYRCLFASASTLINELVSAQKTLTLTQYFKKLDRYDVITLDELGFMPESKEGADLFFQLISQRYERKSLIITTNLTFSEWDKVFLNPITTAAAVDRIIHHCETFNIKGPSKRAEDAKKNMGATITCVDLNPKSVKSAVASVESLPPQ